MKDSDTKVLNIEQAEKETTTQAAKKTEVLHDFSEKPKNISGLLKTILIIAIIVGLGTLTGYFLSNSKSGGIIPSDNKIHTVVKTGKQEGSTDTKTFRDKAEGKLEKGGIEGEGTHKLIRDPKRPDQNVYLTSSVIDLDQYTGKNVRVWGETFAAQKAGWLMDIGKIEVLN